MRMRRARERGVAAVLVLVAAASGSAQRGWQAYQDPYGRFTLRYPSGWKALFGAGATLAVLAEKDGKASVHVEYLRLQQPLDAGRDYDVIVQIERDLIKERESKADQIVALPARPEVGGIVTIEFTRPGFKRVERVRQYSVIRGTDLFRILCVASAAEFARFGPLFDQVARSFASVQPS